MDVGRRYSCVNLEFNKLNWPDSMDTNEKAVKNRSLDQFRGNSKSKSMTEITTAWPRTTDLLEYCTDSQLYSSSDSITS